MDQAEPESKVIYRHQQEYCHDSNLGRIMRVSAFILYPVSIETRTQPSANAEAATAEFV